MQFVSEWWLGLGLGIELGLASFLIACLTLLWRILSRTQPPAGGETAVAVEFLNESYWLDDPGETPLHALEWRRRLVPLVGREAEKRRLISWALETQIGGVHLLNGPGGAGKTRLAAEVAEILREKHGWAAGFANYRAEKPRLERKALVIVDYPEEHRSQVEAWLEDSSLRSKAQWLLVSRLDAERWNRTVSTRVDEATVLDPLADGDLYELFKATFEATPLRLAEDRGSPPPAESFDRWLHPADTAERAARRRALFVQAAAIVCAVDPSRVALVDFSVLDVVDALVVRELQRLESEGRGVGVGGEDLLPRLVALAGLTPSGLQAVHLEALERAGLSGFGEGGVQAWIAAANRRTSYWRQDRIAAAKPDLIAAALAVKVLQPYAAYVAEWLWSILTAREDLTGGLQTMARVFHDTTIDLGLGIGHGGFRLGEQLAAAVAGRPDRAAALESHCSDDTAIYGELVPLAIATWQELLGTRQEEPTRARRLNNLSTHLSAAGREAEALTAIEEAAGISRRLSESAPERFEPDLATSLNNLSNRLSAAGRDAEALTAIEEAVGIRRRLSESAPERFEPDFAMSLNNLSTCLSAAGRDAEALTAIEEAVRVYRRLAESAPERFEPYLAGSLYNLSLRLSAAGRDAAALTAIEEAESRLRPYAEAAPQGPHGQRYAVIRRRLDTLRLP